ncbi:unnamed protein product [Echinostoma caproni]|uniref:Uncharacterized protein n=1 Tax=Echinostoma caproni TaxID=27848 RepID=A0A3P8G0H8_9TREM|nr:unnamed protein product [Echinostoma caproni]
MCLGLPRANEHLLASLIMLFSESSSVDTAIDVENLPKQTATRADLFLDKNSTMRKSFVNWLVQSDAVCANSDDSADAEVRSYIGVLRCLLNKS